jgi:hypothetical protein
VILYGSQNSFQYQPQISKERKPDYEKLNKCKKIRLRKKPFQFSKGCQSAMNKKLGLHFQLDLKQEKGAAPIVQNAFCLKRFLSEALFV